MSEQKRLVSFSDFCAIKGWDRESALHGRIIKCGLPVHSGKRKLYGAVNERTLDAALETLIFDLDEITAWEGDVKK